jgi:hypothetical protein
MMIPIAIIVIIQASALIIVAFRFANLVKLSSQMEVRLKEKITELEDVIFKLSPTGYSTNTLCDRDNPRHSSIAWYLEETDAGKEFTEQEKVFYTELQELNTRYLQYKQQPLQGFRNNSTIWEKGWCHKWEDGIGTHGIGHDHWVAGEFSYHWKTNKEFRDWLIDGGQAGNI